MFTNVVGMVQTVGWMVFLFMVLFAVVLYVKNR